MYVGTLYVTNKMTPTNQTLFDFLKKHLTHINAGPSKGQGLILKFVAIGPKNASEYPSVVKSPTLMVKGAKGWERYEELTNVLDLFRKFMNKGATTQGDVEDEIEAYQKKVLGPIGKDANGRLKVEDTDDFDDDLGNQLQQKMNAALSNRKAMDPKFGAGMGFDLVDDKKETGNQGQSTQPLHENNIDVFNRGPPSRTNRPQPNLQRTHRPQSMPKSDNPINIIKSKPMNGDDDLLLRYLENQEETPM